MNTFAERFALSLRRATIEARVVWSVRRANQSVERAFRFKPAFPIDKVAMFSGAGLTVALLFLTVSYIFTAPTAANVPPEPTHAAVVTPLPAPVTPAAVEPEAPPDPPTINSALAHLPKPAMSLPPPETRALYTLAVDKKKKALLVLEETRDNYRVVMRYTTSLGSVSGDKQVRGDNKTPEGVYRIIGVKEKPELPDRYGHMAFVLNYPNEVDIQQGKTGGGIWIHGSGLGDHTEETEGCVEINDTNIVNLLEFANVGTLLYIFPEDFTIPQNNSVIQKHVIRPDTLYSLKENPGRLNGVIAKRSR